MLVLEGRSEEVSDEIARGEQVIEKTAGIKTKRK